MTKNPSSPYGWEFINDLSAVNEDEDSIIEFLLHRLGRQEIYTWVGPLLLAVNPGKHIIRDLYDESHRKAFANGILEKPKPHIYAIASRAQYRLIHGLGKVCQVIVISGESGTGKTFNARKALDFLAASNVKLNGSENSPEVCRILHKIGNVFPLLSAFSTASTQNNERSSRHGQLIRLQYNKNGIIQGACIRSFLLERTRVTAGSNNFEIFYQLIAGLSDREIDELCLTREGNYVMLGDINENIKKQRFREGFQDTVKAFEALGFTQEWKMNVFRVIALLMHLGNIKFKHKIDEGCAIDLEDKESRKALSNACSLISLTEQELNDLLTSILICPHNFKQRHTSYRRELKTVEDCRNRLFSIARYLYDRLFHWIVARVNETLTINDKNYDWLGILDIFGFESFQTNGLEQLSINYATERLQLYFMEDYLEAGQRELQEEGLEVLPPSFAIQVYRERLLAIEKIVFSTFNDACQSPIPPCLSSLQQQFLSKEKEATPFFKIKNDVFVIKHYSHAVAYNVDNLLAKNTDKVPTELSSAFEKCNNKLLRTLSEVEDENVYGIGCRVSLKKCTALAKLKQSLDCLVKELNKCDSHYVRCTRPRNDNGLWVKNEFREQLVCTGILDALPLAKCKFPIKFTYEEFYKRYSIKRAGNDFDLLCNLSTIIRSVNINSSMIHLGKRLLFMTEKLFFALENHRKNHRSKCAERIQSFWLKTRESRRAKVQNIVVDTQSLDEEISYTKITKSSQSSNAAGNIFIKKLQSIEKNRENTPIPRIEEIYEQLKSISQVSGVVTEASQSSSETDNPSTKKLQSDQESRKNTSILEIEKIDKQLKKISQVSIVVTKSSQSSSEENDLFTTKLQSVQENRKNTSISGIKKIDEQLKRISQISFVVPKPSESSSEEDAVFTKKLQSVQENRKNTSISGIKKIDEQLKRISQISFVISKPSESSSEGEDVFTKKLQSVKENRKNNSISGIKKIDEQLKRISQISFVIPKPSESSSEGDNVFTKKLQSVKENRKSTSISGIKKIDEQLKNISQESFVVPKFFESSSEKSVLTKHLRSVEDYVNNNDPSDNDRHDKKKGNSNMKTVKVSQNFPVPSADTGYCSMGEKYSLRKIGSQLSHEEIQTAGKFLESTSDLIKVVDNTEYFKPISEVSSWKAFYLRNWLESTSSNSEDNTLKTDTKVPNRFNGKLSQNQILIEGSTLKFESNKFALFYRNRILSHRRPVETPIKFHTRTTCLPGSHKLPRSLGPRGLEDCLIEKLVTIEYIGSENQ